ncbi:formylglycine-generating enzyme family protein [bacterium]|nr:formylglycine-generating enzyme family protein [bacterium]
MPRPAPRPPAPAGREAAVDPDKTGIFEGSDAARAAARALFAESLPSEADEIEEEAREDESADDLDDEYDRSLIEMVVETVMPDHEPAGLVPLAERTAWTDFASIPAREPSLAQEDMIEIAAGECAVGDRVVRTGSFFIDRAPVTNAQYRRFVDETGVEPPVHWLDGRPIRGTENYPVVNVTFEAVQAFARWAGKRLPRESEWERAARGSDGRDYPWGDAMDEARCHVDDARGCLVAVDAFPEGASPWGCLDMLGNAGEWVVEDGTDAPVIRGGSYRIPAGLLTLRTRLLPYDGSGSAYVGFRCAWGED